MGVRRGSRITEASGTYAFVTQNINTQVPGTFCGTFWCTFSFRLKE